MFSSTEQKRVNNMINNPFNAPPDLKDSLLWRILRHFPNDNHHPIPVETQE